MHSSAPEAGRQMPGERGGVQEIPRRAALKERRFLLPIIVVCEADPLVRGIALSKVAAAVIVAVIVVAAAAAVIAIPRIIAPPQAVEARGKIAVVTDIGGRGDLSFNDMGIKGAEDAARDFGYEATILVSRTEADYLPNLETAAKDPRTVLVVGVGFLLTDALYTVAQKYPGKNFAGIDTSAQDKAVRELKAPLPNMLDLRFEEHKGSALVGALACLTTAYLDDKGYGYRYVGAVLGIEIPPLWKFEIGYKWGCDWGLKWYERRFGKPAPVIGGDSIYGSGPGWQGGKFCSGDACWYKNRVLWHYTGTFSDVTKGYETAKAMYAKGASIVYNIAGPLGLGINQAVQEIASQRNLTTGPPFWIGVDADQDWINPGFVIASMMKRVDKAVYYAAQLVKEGRFRDAVASNRGVVILGIGTQVEGISVSTLSDLDTFIQFGITAERELGKRILPAPPEEIKTKVAQMRSSIPQWVWDAVSELASKVRSGEVQVPLPTAKEEVQKWRDLLG